MKYYASSVTNFGHILSVDQVRRSNFPNQLFETLDVSHNWGPPSSPIIYTASSTLNQMWTPEKFVLKPYKKNSS